MKQYPHFLYLKTVYPSTQNEEGNWLPQTEQWIFYSMCREQTNGKGSTVNSIDGKAIVFASVVHLPLKAFSLKEGIEVLVSNIESETGSIRIQKQMLKYDRGQLHDRIWL